MKILLHTCCAPCATHAHRALEAQGHAVTLFFYNPNLWPETEREKRRAEALRYAEEAGVAVLAPEPDVARWDDAVAGLESEPEGGRRCDRCFDDRLDATAETAAAGGFDAFASTLSISPHKAPSKIDAAGENAAARWSVPYVATDFKKKGGFQESVRLSREHDLYRQNYCGCRFSMRPDGDRP